MPVSSVPRAERRLGLALSLYVGLVIAIVTLVPFRFDWPPVWRLVGYRGLSDVLANVALFLPFGFFVAFGGRGRPWLAGCALSVAVELLQLTLPSRSPSLIDVTTNSLGAALGGLAFRITASRLERRRDQSRVFALDLPLMGLVYLLVPLLWLSGLAAGNEAGRIGLAALVLGAGALGLGAVDRHAFRPRGARPWSAPLAATVGALVGLAPGWLGRPVVLVGLAVGAGLATAGASRFGSGREESGQRYELPTLVRMALPLGIYLALVALWPVAALGSAWHGTLALAGEIGAVGQVAILRLLELVAGVTVAGYAAAEAGGRLQARRMSGLVGMMLPVGLALGRGFHPAYGTSLVEVTLLAVGFLLGGRLYHLQRRYLRALLGRVEPRARPEPGPAYRIGPPVAAEGAPKWR